MLSGMGQVSRAGWDFFFAGPRTGDVQDWTFFSQARALAMALAFNIELWGHGGG